MRTKTFIFLISLLLSMTSADQSPILVETTNLSDKQLPTALNVLIFLVIWKNHVSTSNFGNPTMA